MQWHGRDNTQHKIDEFKEKLDHDQTFQNSPTWGGKIASDFRPVTTPWYHHQQWNAGMKSYIPEWLAKPMSPLRSEGKVKHDGKCLGFWVELWGNAPITMTMSLLTFLPSDCRGRRLWDAFVEVHGNTYTQTGGLPQSTHSSIRLSKSNPHAGSSNLFLGEHFWCQFDNHIS